MAQAEEWEREYRNPKLLTNSDEPQLDFKHFIKWLRKDWKVNLDGLNVLDLGSGTGKNSLFLAERGSNVTGIEISTTAIRIAKERAKSRNLEADFIHGSIGETFMFPDESFDLILDVVSSNSLSEEERKVYISESMRTLRINRYMFVKALCKDGDKNASYLLGTFPGKEKDTYILPKTGITERVYTQDDLIDTYERYFTIIKLERKFSYTAFQGKSYKRFFWNMYLQKKETKQ
jgi:SAM-dependent methyltransferase